MDAPSSPQAFLTAFEAGYRAAERGENPQAALAEFAALLTAEPVSGRSEATSPPASDDGPGMPPTSISKDQTP